MLARLLRDLAPYQPTLIGTFPLGLQVEGSDLDIACTCADLDAFQHAVRAALAEPAVVFERLALPAVVARCELAGLPVEIFGQALPISAQHGFRHMVIEGQLLALAAPRCATACWRSSERASRPSRHLRACSGSPAIRTRPCSTSSAGRRSGCARCSTRCSPVRPPRRR